MLSLVLLVFSFVLAVIASCIVTVVAGRWHLGWLAFAFFVAAQIAGSALR